MIMLTLIKHTKPQYWLYSCDCGKEVELVRWNVTSGRTSHCGCKSKPLLTEKDFLNKKFLKLSVIGVDMKTKMAECMCDCWKSTRISIYHLGKVASCWCARVGKQNRLKHWMAITGKRTPFYVVWCWIHQRCNTKSDGGYPKYGGRGIKCEWKSFTEFKDDTYASYLDWVEKCGKVYLTRIDSDGNYSKENCFWVSKLPRRGKSK